jgi:hypothetical protein
MVCDPPLDSDQDPEVPAMSCRLVVFALGVEVDAHLLGRPRRHRDGLFTARVGQHDA